MTVKMFVDHLGRKVEIPYPPQRIISLCPSITETLYDFGLDEQIAGRTQFCIHPANKVEQAVIVGGTKQIKAEKIEAIQPDLIIAEKEENTKEMVEALAEKYPVYVAKVENYEESLRMIRDLGEITNRTEQAGELVEKIEQRFGDLHFAHGRKVAYVVWKDPYMVVGSNTFVDSILAKCGLENVFRNRNGRYPEVTLEDFREASPDYLLLSSEPYPYKEPHRREFAELFPGMTPLLVDGEMFIWYGARMVQAVDYLNELLGRMQE